jgi:hypothetical protein
MLTLTLEAEPLAVEVTIAENSFSIHLDDGRVLSIPLAWYPRLLHATSSERQNWQLLGDGYAIEWPEIDEHIGVEGLLAGRKSGESQTSFDKWLATRPQ